MIALLRRLLLWTATCLAGAAHAAAPAGPSMAFFYGPQIPWESLGAFDLVVVEPDHVPQQGWAHRLNPGTEVAAYIAVGEVHPSRPYYAKIPVAWRNGANRDWGSIVIDQTANGWQEFYVREVVEPLWQRGFRAFFLDTLDSFYIAAKTPDAQKLQFTAQAALIKAIKRAHPDAKLIFNRGFEMLPEVHGLVHAVVAESLFQGWDAGRQAYRDVPANDHQWLLAQLLKCRDDYRLPVVSIDYVDPLNRDLARTTAKRIEALGITPWVSNPELNMLGIGRVEVLPRTVLAIHDEPGNVSVFSSHEIHRVGTLPLNYLGLDPQYAYYDSPELKRLSTEVLAGRFAGIVLWFNRGKFPETPALLQLLSNALKQQVPVVMLGDFPSDAVLDRFGMDSGEGAPEKARYTVEKLSPHVGFEIDPKPLTAGLVPISVRPGTGDVWLRFRSDGDVVIDAIAITRWGGYAAERYWKLELPNDKGERWAVNPIEFFRAALKIPPHWPVPDVTTENGRRLLLTHIDGDAFPSRAEIPGTPLGSEVMRTDFIERYRIPTTVSVVQGEVGATGLFKAVSPEMESIAKKIFALPHVEIATHTFSHPFYWADAELGIHREGRVVGLKIPGYTYDVDAEISGSARYIDTRLAPPGKRTRMVLWSGDTQPLETPVRKAYEAGMLNMNSGNTWISKAEPTLTVVGPLGMLKGDWYQVYAPHQNENNYTNLWTGPFYGYERVIETFDMTDVPLRLKPINIYYHTYIATKRAGINSLHKVYQYAMAQPHHATFSTEYAQRVLDWRRATVARSSQGLELRAGGGALRQWRIERTAFDALDWQASSRLVGFEHHQSVTYLHASSPIAVVSHTQWGALASTQLAGPVLKSANARLTEWTERDGVVTVRFKGHEPVIASFATNGCAVESVMGFSKGSARVGADGLLNLEGATGGESAQAVFRCPR
jgi:polysaccharide biosynthesis protein PelA